MATIKFKPLGPPLSGADIHELAGLLGVPLPADYAAFLLSCNGAMSEDDERIVVPSPGWFGGDEANVHALFGYKYVIRCWDIWNATYGIQERLPPGCISIGCDATGSVYVLRGDGPNVGEVLLRDTEDEIPDDPYSALYPVADSFSEFLEIMYTEPRSY
ncbi:MAG: SMI1/KNR4 family protein [Phycisphaeraceae bacterium]|nr:SMI1/KNR4 family protein [Phycisphaeraceae bacterium]